MGKKEYMEILLSQIRNDKAKELVGQEIEAHIDDQTEVYMEFGVEPELAEKKAVRSMGDPVETGVSLDRIHKPKMSWSMIVLVGILSVLGLAIQGVSWMQTGELFFFYRQIAFVIVGFICMMVICMVDYSRILYRSRLVAVLYLVVTLLFFLNGTQTNGSLWLHVGGISFSWHFIMYLSIPIFGMLLYQYRRQKKVHLLIPIAFMVVVLLLFWYLGNSNLVFANILLMAVILLTYAIAKGWYPVKIKRSIGILWGCCIGIPLVVGGLMVSHLAVIQGYAARRLSYFFEGHGPHAIYGTWRPVREILQNTYWFGGGQVDMKAVDATSILSDYVLLHVAAFFGIFFLVVIIALLGLLCVKLFHLSMKQKNQAGAIIGIACGLIFTVQIAEYVLMNLGLIPGTTVFLPLFSYGGSGTVVSFILLGLLLSIYRYQNLVMEPKRKKRLVIKVVDM